MWRVGGVYIGVGLGRICVGIRGKTGDQKGIMWNVVVEDKSGFGI